MQYRLHQLLNYKKFFTTISIKILSTYDDFEGFCFDQDPLSENNKERSKRVLSNVELKYSATTSQESHSKHKPSTASAINFKKALYVQLPVLSILVKVHSVTCGSDLLSDSAFLCSVYFAPQKRSHLSEENLAHSSFL